MKAAIIIFYAATRIGTQITSRGGDITRRVLSPLSVGGYRGYRGYRAPPGATGNLLFGRVVDTKGRDKIY